MKNYSIVFGVGAALLIFFVVFFGLKYKSQNHIDSFNKNKNFSQNAENLSQENISLENKNPNQGDINKNTDKKENKNMEQENKNYTKAILHTNFGDISFEFAKDKPLTTQNFIKLASSKFYDGVKFHRVIKDFMIQAGDPLSKDNSKKSYWGTGGPDYKFNDELTGNEKYVLGTVAMANSGPNTNGSQFFIMTSNTPLPPLYTVFGKVVAGQEVAQKIQEVKTDTSDRPLEDVIINSVELK